MPEKSTKRKSLSKKTRFEVFKRDKFTCNYCGQKAPDIVLHVDHIEPVSRGGGNDLLNLITSCFDCNSGKSDRKLNDNEVIKKQSKQLEHLQEKREQQEMMLEWKKSLLKIEDDAVEEAVNYLEEKISPYTLSKNSRQELKSHIKKYGIEEVFEAINISTTQYLKYESSGDLTMDSANFCIQKIGGILYNRNLSPIEKVLGRIRNDARNNFDYFNLKTASIILKSYVHALRKFWKYSDEQILNDLENELIPKLEEKRSWTQWKEFIEGWSQEIEKKKNNHISSDQGYEYTEEKFLEHLEYTKGFLSSDLTLLKYLLKPLLEKTKEVPEKVLYFILNNFLDETIALDEKVLKEITDQGHESAYISSYVCRSLKKYIDYLYSDVNNPNSELIFSLEGVIQEQLEETLLSYLWLPKNSVSPYCEKERSLLKEFLSKTLLKQDSISY